MKNLFMATLLIFCISITVAMAQTKKPATTTKKPTTTVKSSASKTKTTKKTTATTTVNMPVVPAIVEQKTTTTTPTQSTMTSTPATKTTIQFSGPPKEKNTSEPKPEKGRGLKPERVQEPRERKGSSGGIKFGMRAEASQIVTFEEGVNLLFSPGFNAGLIVNIPISAKLAVQPEILYSMQTVKIDGVL